MLYLRGGKKKICLSIFISYIKIIYQEIIVCAFLSKMFKAQVSCNDILSNLSQMLSGLLSVCLCACVRVCVCECERECVSECARCYLFDAQWTSLALSISTTLPFLHPLLWQSAHLRWCLFSETFWLLDISPGLFKPSLHFFSGGHKQTCSSLNVTCFHHVSAVSEPAKREAFPSPRYPGSEETIAMLSRSLLQLNNWIFLLGDAICDYLHYWLTYLLFPQFIIWTINH